MLRINDCMFSFFEDMEMRNAFVVMFRKILKTCKKGL